MTRQENLAYKISDFFERYDMLCGASWKEMYDAVLHSLWDRDVSILLHYFIDIKWANKKAQEIYSELLEYVDEKK